MNPTHKRSSAERNAARQTSRAQLKSMVTADLNAAAPAAGDSYAGERQIGRIYKPLTQRYAYFSQETQAALCLMIVLTLMVIATPLLLGWGLWSTALVAIAAIGAVICAHRWYFHRFGPEFIAIDRWENARKELQDAGDAGQLPAGLLPTLTLVGIAGVDGFLSGSSLTTGVFANIFTPLMATLAATAWGIGATYLLFKMVHAAAFEANVNERRSMIRNLSVSPDPADQDRARRMKAAVGDALDQSLDRHADRKSARVGLICAALVLALSMFALRMGSDSRSDPPSGGGSYTPAKMIKV